MDREPRRAPALALLTLLLGVFVYGGLFGGEIAGDDLTFHLAESARLSDCIRAGDFDWWNPSANAGYASAYYYQVIPQLASAVPAAIFGHLLFWFQLSNWLPLVLAPAAAYRGMRLLGATPWQAFAGAFAVGMMNGESRWGSGAAGSFMVGLYTQTWALSAFPLALGYGGRWIMRGDKLAPAVAWGAFVGLCHPFAVIGLGIALAVGTIARMVPTRNGRLAELGRRAARDRRHLDAPRSRRARRSRGSRTRRFRSASPPRSCCRSRSRAPARAGRSARSTRSRPRAGAWSCSAC